MTRYVYVCKQCDEVFELDVDENDVPAEATCPKCGDARAAKLMPAAFFGGGACASSGC